MVFSYNPEGVIFSFSSYEVTNDKMSALFKGLNFSDKPGLIEYSRVFTTF